MSSNYFENMIEEKRKFKQDSLYFVEKWSKRGEHKRAARNQQAANNADLIIAECEKALAAGAPYPSEQQFKEHLESLLK